MTLVDDLMLEARLVREENARLRAEVERLDRAQNVIRDLCASAGVHHPELIYRNLIRAEARVQVLEGLLGRALSAMEDARQSGLVGYLTLDRGHEWREEVEE
jgi:hypothetical protein